VAFSNTTLSHLWESLPRLDTDSLHCERDLAPTGMGISLKLAILMWQSQATWRDFRDYPPRDGFGGFRDTAILVAYSSYF